VPEKQKIQPLKFQPDLENKKKTQTMNSLEVLGVHVIVRKFEQEEIPVAERKIEKRKHKRRCQR
jgi:hypothetical protein